MCIIRNWTTRIKSGAFEQKLFYNTKPDMMNDVHLCYNGNIAATTWTYNNQLNGYSYNYDRLNRYTGGYAYVNSEMQVDYQFSEQFWYDKMGNIRSLWRGDNQDITDALHLTYNGNQVTNIRDAGISQGLYNTKEYQDKSKNDYNTSVIEMAYDGNGNLTKDLDRDIVTIRYNLLNLRLC